MNITLVWELPTTRESGKPLAVTDIQHVAVEVSANGGADWASIGTFGPELTSVPVSDLDFGIWTFRGIVVDTKGRASAPVETVFVVEDTTAPSALVSLTAVPA
jgi:hypothetical protein